MVHFQVYIEVVEMVVFFWVLTPCSDRMFLTFQRNILFWLI